MGPTNAFVREYVFAFSIRREILPPSVKRSCNGHGHYGSQCILRACKSDSRSNCSFQPETPKALTKGDSDSAFSFPVTPPSEPPAAAEPGSVFGTWPSQKNPSRKYSKGDLNSRASSEYAASGYSTDEGGSQPLSVHDGLTLTNPRRSNECATKAGLHLGLDGGAISGLGHDPSSADPAHTAESHHSASHNSTGVPKSPLGIQPLDMGMSLQAKNKLDFGTRKAGPSSTPSEEGALQAYKPSQPGAVDEMPQAFSNRSGEYTERAPETPVGGEESTAGGGAASGDDYSSVNYHWDEDRLSEDYEILTLKIIHRKKRTGFEECKDIAIHVNDLIAGRYQVTDFLGSAAFSQAVQALDIKTGGLVCLKIIKNNKDYMDQSLDEIKLLKYVNEHDPEDQHGILQLYDYFYFKEHLFLVCELLRANLYEFQKYNREQAQDPYFTLPRVQSIARQVLKSLTFMHSLDLIHCDLKPENILIKSYSRCEVKVIDLGSSCFKTDHLSSYVQSRSYRAPEVILGLEYNQSVDIWSLGCILAELLSGYVLLQNDSLATLLARLEGILGPIPRRMLREGRYSHRYYTKNGELFEQSPRTGRYELLKPKRTSLKYRVPEADEGCLDFLGYLLTIDPKRRPSAQEALKHPWLHYKYPNSPL